ncbi:hypothetical protein J4H73_24095 [Vibrio alginolyticus]|uniref:hypothetical protein n=1 Tax=Vibrio alginolyticus TaxID=663 RepID=UPI001BD4CB79|nr:hypothetical protein [Vibrio alginolyticus]MBT0087497.1 hypothetical protein [Vibrio alginolyticus]
MVEEHCKNIVEFKAGIDRALSILVKLGKINCRAKQASVEPLRYLQAALPFYSPINQPYLGEMLVCSELVVGSTYNNYEHIEVTHKYLDEINSNSAKGINSALYFKVGKFPLYMACEGKNRVSAFRKLKKGIFCVLKSTEYPRPYTLSFHRVIGREGVYFLYCRDPRFVKNGENYRQIYFPKYTLPLLKTYGVSEGQPIKKRETIMSKRQMLEEFSRYFNS